MHRFTSHTNLLYVRRTYLWSIELQRYTARIFLQTQSKRQHKKCTTPHIKQTMVITFDVMVRLNRNLVCIYIILYIYRLFNKNLNYRDTLSFYQSSEQHNYRCNATATNYWYYRRIILYGILTIIPPNSSLSNNGCNVDCPKYKKSEVIFSIVAMLTGQFLYSCNVDWTIFIQLQCWLSK